MNKLQEIVNHTRTEIEFWKKNHPVEQLQERSLYESKTRSLIDQFKKDFGIIAEFKRRSPSAGTIQQNADPVETAFDYINSGAVGISVLTDEKYFGGSLHDIEQVSKAVHIPVLRKDFIIDEYQLHEAKAFGADAVLLIADIVSKQKLHALFTRASGLNLECLVEIYDESVIDNLDFSVMKLIGINNRDLRTFTVDLNHTKEVIKKLPADVIVISESGIQNSDDLNLVKSFGAKGALIGESLMRNRGRLFEFVNKQQTIGK